MGGRAYFALRSTVRASAAAASVLAMTSTGPQAQSAVTHSHAAEVGPLLRDREPSAHSISGNPRSAYGAVCPDRPFAQNASQLHPMGTLGPSISPDMAYRCSIEAGYSPWQSVIIVAIMGSESRREPTVYNPTPVGSNNAVGVLQILTNVQDPGGYNMHGITLRQATNPAASLRAAHNVMGGSGPSWWVPWKGEVGVGTANAFCKFMPVWYRDTNPSSAFYCASGGGAGVPAAYAHSPPAGYVPGRL